MTLKQRCSGLLHEVGHKEGGEHRQAGDGVVAGLLHEVGHQEGGEHHQAGDGVEPVLLDSSAGGMEDGGRTAVLECELSDLTGSVLRTVTRVEESLTIITEHCRETVREFARSVRGRGEITSESVSFPGLQYVVLDTVSQVVTHSLVESSVLLLTLLTAVGNTVTDLTVLQPGLVRTVTHQADPGVGQTVALVLSQLPAE